MNVKILKGDDSNLSGNPFVNYEASDDDVEDEESGNDSDGSRESGARAVTSASTDDGFQERARVTAPILVSVEELEGLCYAEELQRRIVAHRNHRTVEPFSAASEAYVARRQRIINVSGTRKFTAQGCSAEGLHSTMFPVGHDAPPQFLRVAGTFQLLHRHGHGERHRRPLLGSIVCARRRCGTGPKLTRAVGIIAALLVVDEEVVAEIRGGVSGGLGHLRINLRLNFFLKRDEPAEREPADRERSYGLRVVDATITGVSPSGCTAQAVVLFVGV